VGAALYSGLKQEPVPCDLCAGNGGIACFACSGGGTSSSSVEPLIDPQGAASTMRRFSRASSAKPGSCRVCKGKGLIICSKCRGSGWMRTF
jgi:hypothetical protein